MRQEVGVHGKTFGNGDRPGSLPTESFLSLPKIAKLSDEKVPKNAFINRKTSEPRPNFALNAFKSMEICCMGMREDFKGTLDFGNIQGPESFLLRNKTSHEEKKYATPRVQYQ